MEIRRASETEMLALWGYGIDTRISPTARFFSENISSGNAEFWAIDDGGKLIAELYVFKNLEDKDFADGMTKGYLCSFRVSNEYQGKGLGSWLLENVLGHMKKCEFKVATIGVDESEEANIRLYNRFGFENKIKECFVDPCALDERMTP